MKFSFEALTTATPGAVWQHYADVNNWFGWEDDLIAIHLDGPFEKGISGEMTLTGMPPMSFDLVEVTKNRSFCDETKIICKIKEPEYIPQLLEVCETEKIDCLIPTIDTDLLLLAENKEKFETIGTKVLISAVDKVRLCRDKRYTADYFMSIGLKSPIPVDDVEKYNLGYPAFIKPKDGSSSIDAYKVNNEEDLKTYAKKIKDYSGGKPPFFSWVLA